MNKLKKRKKNLVINKYSLGVRVTHKCNKMCHYCAQLITTDAIKDITIDAYKYMLECIEDSQDSLSRIVLTGGETFVYPHVVELVEMTRDKYPELPILILTNGKLAPKFDYLLEDKVHFLISEYPRWNDDVINKYQDNPHCIIGKYKGFIDPELIESITEEHARNMFKICRMRKEIRYEQDKDDSKRGNLFPCCVESMPQRLAPHLVNNNFIKLTPNWESDLKKLNAWQSCLACRISFTALCAKSGRERKIYEHDDSFECVPSCGDRDGD